MGIGKTKNTRTMVYGDHYNDGSFWCGVATIKNTKDGVIATDIRDCDPAKTHRYDVVKSKIGNGKEMSEPEIGLHKIKWSNIRKHMDADTNVVAKMACNASNRYCEPFYRIDDLPTPPTKNY